MPLLASQFDDSETATQATSRHRAAIERLRQSNLRATSQRIAVLASFEYGKHFTADEIHERALNQSVDIDRATTYRTLERFQENGILSETDLGDGYCRFELLHDVLHHHAICTVCGQSFELDDELIQPLRQGILRRHGFTARIDHLALFGLCATCTPAERHRDSAPPVESPLV